MTAHDDFIVGDGVIPRLIEAKPAGGYRIRVTYNDGVNKIVDLTPSVMSKKLFEPFRDNPELFKLFHICNNGGGIEWNEQLDACGMWLHMLPACE